MTSLACNNLVSIIIPVYNTEKYLEHCITSVLNQTYKNIEVILVNDGSTDNSGEICDKYATKDCRIKVIHQKNSGVSTTRNIGISVAVGQYIQFIDSDDSIDPIMTENLINAVNDNIQLVICGYKSINLDRQNRINAKEYCPNEYIYNKTDFMLHFADFFNSDLINPPWNKLYSANLIRKYNIHYLENINLGEDLLFNLDYIKICDFIATVNTPLYLHLNQDMNSLTTGYKKDFFINQKMLFESVRKFILDNGCYEENQDLIQTKFTDRIVVCLQNLFHKSSDLNLDSRRKKILQIIYDESVADNIKYFTSGNFQKKIIGILIEKKLILGIYFYFRLKTLIKNVTDERR